MQQVWLLIVFLPHERPVVATFWGINFNKELNTSGAYVYFFFKFDLFIFN